MAGFKRLQLALMCFLMSLGTGLYAATSNGLVRVVQDSQYVHQGQTVINYTVYLDSAHLYPHAGIKMAGTNYMLSSNSSCTPQSNGWCTGPLGAGQSQKITLISRAGQKLILQIALSAIGQPISTYEYHIKPFLEGESASGRVIGYLYGWETPPPAAAIAAAGYTHILIAFGLFSTSSPGTINLDAISGFDLASYVQSLHQNNVKVLLSLGGASTNIPNTTVNFDQAVQLASSPNVFVNNMMSSMANLVTTYGFDGFDFDIESGLNGANSFTNPSQGCSLSTYSSACDIYYLSSIMTGFHTQYPTPYLTLVPQIANISATSSFNATWGNYASLLMQVYSALEWVAFQNYNAGCAYGIDLICYPTTGSLTSTADPAVAFATDILANWPAQTASGQTTGFLPYVSFLKPSQVVIGYVVTNATDQTDGDPSVSPYLSIAKNAIQCLRTGQQCATYTPPATYPEIGGVFAWTVNYDATVNYQFATTLSPCVVGGNCS